MYHHGKQTKLIQTQYNRLAKLYIVAVVGDFTKRESEANVHTRIITSQLGRKYYHLLLCVVPGSRPKNSQLQFGKKEKGHVCFAEPAGRLDGTKAEEAEESQIRTYVK